MLLTCALATCLPFNKFALANMIPVPPINKVFILSSGSIEPFTPLIVRQGNSYIFTGDFTNTTLVLERDGITLDGADHSMSGHSTSYQQAIDISNRTNITIKNVLFSQFGVGVAMDHASNNTLTENQMSTFAAFLMVNADNNHIIGNTVTQGYGIYGSGSYNLIMNNSFSGGLSGGGNGMGIYLSGNNNTITQNTIIHGVSINMGSSQYNTISNNTILNGSGSGILLAKSSNNIVCGNLIGGKTDSESGALYISHDSFNNVVFQNTFENNALAIALGAQVATLVWNSVYDNRFYENDFLNNTQNVWIAPGAPVNFWDNGQQGNYWSNFHGVDSNHNGISETPYAMNANNTDNYPLMTPHNNLSTLGQIPEYPALTTLLVLLSAVTLATIVTLKKKKS